MKMLITALFLFLTLPLAAQADGHGEKVMAGAIEITELRARPTIGNLKTTAAYMTLKNTGTESDRLIGVSGDIAMALELHTHIKDGDIMRMRRLKDGITLDPGESHVLKPGGDHVMIMQMKEGASVGDTLGFTLVFEKAGEVNLSAPVMKIKPHGH